MKSQSCEPSESAAMPSADKPKKENQINFRATDAKRAWIDAKVASSGKSREQLMLEAVDLLMYKEATVDHPNRGLELAEYESHVNAAFRMFRASVDTCHNTELRVREEFARQLDSKDQVIADYQSQITALQADHEALATVTTECAALKAELAALAEQAKIDSIDAANRLAEKDRLLTVLDENLTRYKHQAEGYIELLQERNDLAAQLSSATATMKGREKDHQMELERLKMTAHQAQIDAVLAAQKEMQTQLEDLRGRLVAAQAEAKSLQGFKADNDLLRERLGEQNVHIALLEQQIQDFFEYKEDI
ncbi:MAG: hypothetical protein IKY18_00320 [Oscillospiraceae bacterium]|nr:hypothetical protein [Oscillospiraceae bacterium]